MNEIRIELVREAVNEIWVKLADMQAGIPLSSDEWLLVIRVVDKRMEQIQIGGRDWTGSSS